MVVLSPEQVEFCTAAVWPQTLFDKGTCQGVRARAVITRRTARALYKFPSIKLRRPIYCESAIELDYAYLLDIDGDVSTFQEQPGKIPYILHGQLLSYTPDFLVLRLGRWQIVEVKPRGKIDEEDNQLLFRAIEPICRNAGCEFIVAPDDEIQKEPRLYNVKLFWKYGRVPVHPQHHIYCREFFSRTPQSSLAELFEFFASRNQPKQVVYSLLYRGVVEIDIMESLSSDSVVQLPA
jgi:hypothetical protein